MFLLVFNISPNYLNIRPAYRKSTIPLLPAEIPLIRKLLMNPLGGTGFIFRTNSDKLIEAGTPANM